MNIFVVHADPDKAAKQLPDKHVTKMILESAQMLSIVFSKHYWDIGEVMKVDGTPFKTERGAFKNHPCTLRTTPAPSGRHSPPRTALGLYTMPSASATSLRRALASDTALLSLSSMPRNCSTVRLVKQSPASDVCVPLLVPCPRSGSSMTPSTT